jgi:hypothetical protein
MLSLPSWLKVEADRSLRPDEYQARTEYVTNNHWTEDRTQKTRQQKTPLRYLLDYCRRSTARITFAERQTELPLKYTFISLYPKRHQVFPAPPEPNAYPKTPEKELGK